MDKAQLASNLLLDEFFNGEIALIKQSYIDSIVNSQPSDYDRREEAYKALLAINALISHFESLAAQKQIDSKRWKIF